MMLNLIEKSDKEDYENLSDFFIYKEEMTDIYKNFPLKFSINTSDPL